MLSDYQRINEGLDNLIQKDIDILFEEIKKIDGSSAIHILGNGGSAANASHIVGDFTKTFSLMNSKITTTTPIIFVI